MDNHNDSLAEFESALTAAKTQPYVLRLFVSGTTPASMLAIKNLKQLCDEHLCGRYELEVIDIYQQPELAVAEQIVAAPTLVKKSPPPARKFIGNLANVERLAERLGLRRDAHKE